MSKRKRRHFTAKAAARCVAYTRRDGADDYELAKLIVTAYGLENVPCIMAQAFLLVADVVFMTATLTLLQGCLMFIKGVKIMVEGRISKPTIDPFDLLVYKLWPELQTQYGALLMWLGAVETLTSTLTALITSFSDQLAYYKFLEDVCKTKVPANPFPITPKPPDFKSFYDGDESDKEQIQRYKEFGEMLFPD